MREPVLKSAFGSVKKIHPLAWLWETLEGDAGFLLRPMFGGKAAYLDGKLALYFAAGKGAEWSGVCVCTSREHHASLVADFPQLRPHAILPKWLFLPETDERFEVVAEKLVALVKRRDPRVGVIGKSKQKAGARKKK